MINYSTTEQKIGTWTDGSDVYQRVVTSSSSGSMQSWYTCYTDESIKEIIDCRAFSSQDGVNSPKFLFYPQARVNGNDVQFWCYTAHVMAGDLIILTYTKK